jgi:hypothetical protein
MLPDGTRDSLGSRTTGALAQSVTSSIASGNLLLMRLTPLAFPRASRFNLRSYPSGKGVRRTSGQLITDGGRARFSKNAGNYNLGREPFDLGPSRHYRLACLLG